MTRYRDLKDERDDAVARALEAERLSMKSEFDRVTAEFEHEKERLLSLTNENARAAYRNGFNAGIDTMADDIEDRLKHRSGLIPPSLKKIERGRGADECSDPEHPDLATRIGEASLSDECKSRCPTCDRVRALESQRDDLWALLDNIDTLDDACRNKDGSFRELARAQQKRRWAIYNPDEVSHERRGGSGEDGGGSAPEGNDRVVEVPEALGDLQKPSAGERVLARTGGADSRAAGELGPPREEIREFIALVARDPYHPYDNGRIARDLLARLDVVDLRPKSAMRCTKHNGYGFTSDCTICKENDNATENQRTT